MRRRVLALLVLGLMVALMLGTATAALAKGPPQGFPERPPQGFPEQAEESCKGHNTAYVHGGNPPRICIVS